MKTKVAVALIWTGTAIIAMVIVGCFALAKPEAPTHGYLALPAVDAVAKATKDLGRSKPDPEVLQAAADRLKDLENGVDPKKLDDLRHKVGALAMLIGQAADRARETSNEVAMLGSATRELEEEAASVRATLKTVQAEGTQWKANLISSLLWFLLLSALLVVLFVSPNLSGVSRAGVSSGSFGARRCLALK